MERIDDLMERLKGQMPQVPGADDLTDSIMASKVIILKLVTRI